MSKIDVLIIVHNEHEGLLSVRNSGRVLEVGVLARDAGLPAIPVIC